MSDLFKGMSSLPPKEHLAAYDMLIACRKQIQETELCNAELCRMIESSPLPINYTDPDLLMLKVRKQFLSINVFNFITYYVNSILGTSYSKYFHFISSLWSSTKIS